MSNIYYASQIVSIYSETFDKNILLMSTSFMNQYDEIFYYFENKISIDDVENYVRQHKDYFIKHMKNNSPLFNNPVCILLAYLIENKSDSRVFELTSNIDLETIKFYFYSLGISTGIY